MKIYTKTGDDGTTSLIGGHRVAKYDQRVEAYGSVDELSAHVAMLRGMLRKGGIETLMDELNAISSRLMSIEALFAVDSTGADKVHDLTDDDILFLESRIDAHAAQLPRIDKFTIAPADTLVAQVNICRTVCRRAERRARSAAEQYPYYSVRALRYLNRLSDYFYTLSRKLTLERNVEEVLWIP